MTIIEEKKALRKEMLQQRLDANGSGKEEYDTWICEALEKIIDARQCKIVHAYIPMANEIDTRPLLQKLMRCGVTIVCPKTLPKMQLENRVLHSLEEVEVGIMGTLHPRQADIYEGPIDLVIVPGLAFDNEKHRLGYGGAYYDTFLITIPQAYKVGIFYPYQRLERVPTEQHDIQLDEVLYREF